MVQWVTHSPPTSEVGGLNPGPYVGQLVVAYRSALVYSAESSPTSMYSFPPPFNCHDITYTMC